MRMSQRGLGLLKAFEGFSAEVYICPAGVRTVGYGHVVRAGERFATPLLPQQAEELLRTDVEIFEKQMVDLVEVEVGQNQWDALVCFVFNVGVAAFKRSSLLRKINDEDFQGAGVEFGRWVYAGGKILPGLVKRRAAEAALFLQAQE